LGRKFSVKLKKKKNLTQGNISSPVNQISIHTSKDFYQPWERKLHVCDRFYDFANCKLSKITLYIDNGKLKLSTILLYNFKEAVHSKKVPVFIQQSDVR